MASRCNWIYRVQGISRSKKSYFVTAGQAKTANVWNANSMKSKSLGSTVTAKTFCQWALHTMTTEPYSTGRTSAAV